MSLNPQTYQFKKIYYNASTNETVTSDNTSISGSNYDPSIALGQKLLLNAQILNDDGTVANLGAGVSAWFGADIDYLNKPPILESASTDWELNTGNYEATVTDTLSEVYKDGVALTEDATLSAVDTWTQVETLVTVKLDAGEDPTAEDDGYISYRPTVGDDYTPLFLESQSDYVNLADSWYDEDLGTWSTPNPLIGQISVVVNANTINFYDRLSTDANTQLRCQIQLVNSYGEDSAIYTFFLTASNKYTSDSLTPLELGEDNYYDKTAIDAKVALKVDKPTGVVGSEWLFTINSAGVLTQTSFKITSSDQLLIPIEGEAGYISLTGKRDSITGLVITDIEEYTG